MLHYVITEATSLDLVSALNIQRRISLRIVEWVDFLNDLGVTPNGHDGNRFW
jgi:hypothetical protein